MAVTKARNVRISDMLWDRLRARAEADGVTITDVIRAAVLAYLR